jgi:hypothetical protein
MPDTRISSELAPRATAAIATDFRGWTDTGALKSQDATSETPAAEARSEGREYPGI